MPVATATATANVSSTQSLVLVRNLMRLGISQIAFTRGLLPKDSFELRDISGVRCSMLGGADVSEESKTLMTWLEKGVFPALSLRYLEKAVLVVSADEAATKTIEAWTLSIDWIADDEGTEHAVIKTGGRGRSGVLATKVGLSRPPPRARRAPARAPRTRRENAL